MPENIALVVLDTLREDSFSDNFDFLSGISFNNAHAPSHWTIPAHASMLTGKYPSEVGVHAKSPSFDTPDTSLVESLQENEYQTRLWSANANLTAWDGWNRGFEEYVTLARLYPGDGNLVDWAAFARNNDVAMPRKLLRAVGHALSSDAPTIPAVKQGYRFLRRSRADGGTRSVIERTKATDFDDSEFLLINLMEAHTPYHDPNGGDETVSVCIGDAFADTVDDPDYIRRAYESSVDYLSEALEELYELLIADFDYVFVVGDHGEMLGEQGMWNHGYGLYPELVHVPMVIDGPDINDREHDGVVSLIDVHKTIAEIAGIEIESRGQDLLDDPEERPVLTEYHGFRPSHRDQFERTGAPPETYDDHDSPLHGIVLPDGYAHETHSNGFQTHGNITTEAAKSQLETLLATREVREVDEDDTEIDEATKQQLRELGYA